MRPKTSRTLHVRTLLRPVVSCPSRHNPAAQASSCEVGLDDDAGAAVGDAREGPAPVLEERQSSITSQGLGPAWSGARRPRPTRRSPRRQRGPRSEVRRRQRGCGTRPRHRLSRSRRGARAGSGRPCARTRGGRARRDREATRLAPWAQAPAMSRARAIAAGGSRAVPRRPVPGSSRALERVGNRHERASASKTSAGLATSSPARRSPMRTRSEPIRRRRAGGSARLPRPAARCATPSRSWQERQSGRRKSRER